MMPTDNLRCEVIPNAVDVQYLSCETTPLENLDLWGSINDLASTAGVWATVGATLLLAYFAWKAWNTSQETLKKMEKQIEASRELSIESGQRSLARKYCAALLELSEAARRSDSDMGEYERSVTTAWTMWGMEMFIIDPEFRELTGQWNARFKRKLGHLRFQQGSARSKFRGPELLSLSIDAESAIVGQYVGNLQTWEVNPKRREEIKIKFRDIAAADND